MAYTQYNDAQPVGTDLGTAVPGEINFNTNALRDMLGGGQAQGFDFSITAGTGTAEEPQFYFLKKGTTWIRFTATWTTGKLTGLKWEKSINSGTDYTTAPGGTILSADQVFTYDGSGNLTAVTNASGLASLLWYVIAKAKSLLTNFNAHTAATGAAVHGLGTISTQAASAVAITGGSVIGVTLEYTTARGKKIDLGTITGSVAVDWSAGDYFYGTFSGASGALTWSNLPGTSTAPAGSVTLELTNSGLATSPWPAGVKWPSAVAPTRTSSGIDLYEFVCRDGSTVRGAQAQKDSR